MMFFSSQTQKIIAGLLLAAVLIPSFSFVADKYLFEKKLAMVPIAEAACVFGTGDCATLGQQIIDYILDGLDYIKQVGIYISGLGTQLNTLYNNIFNAWVQNVFKVLLEYFKLKLLDMLSTQIVNWITGGKLGGPQYVTNWSNFLGEASRDALNIVISEVDKASGGLICTNYAALLRNLLRVNIGIPGVPYFQYQLSCSLGQIVSNINNFYADFTRGGWQGYVTLLQPNNNYYGSMITVLDYRNQLEASRQRAAQNEGLASQGFLSTKRCKTPTVDAGTGGLTGQCDEWEVTTPGKTLAGAIDSAATNRFGYINGMSQFASIVAILTDSVLNKLIGAGIAGLAGASAGYVSSQPGNGYIQQGTNFENCDVLAPGPTQDACNASKEASGPSVTLSAAKGAVNPGDETTLSFTALNAASCESKNFSMNSGVNFGSGQSISGVVPVKPQETTSYSVTCTNAAGQSSTAFATVTVAGSQFGVYLTANPNPVASGQNTTLSWGGSDNVVTCSGGGFDTGSKASGSVSVGVGSYSVTCTSATGGTASQSITVQGSPASAVSTPDIPVQ